MEIKAEKKYMPQELADRCLKEFQKKEPDEGYWACTPVKEKPDHFVLLGSSSRPKEVMWEPDRNTFTTMVDVRADAHEPKEKKSEDDPIEWVDIPEAKTGFIPGFFAALACLVLIGSVLLFLLSMNFALPLAGIISSALLFAVSAIVRSLRRIERYTYIIANNSTNTIS